MGWDAKPASKNFLRSKTASLGVGLSEISSRLVQKCLDSIDKIDTEH